MVCRSGPDRMQIAPLLKNIDVILQSKLNYKAYITQLDSIFTDSINTPSKTIISKILQINIDGITSNSTFTIPEDLPIIHYIKKKKNKNKPLKETLYKNITVKDLCIIISTLLRYKEYEPMFDGTPRTIKWFYNNIESNNKYIDLFNT